MWGISAGYARAAFLGRIIMVKASALVRVTEAVGKLG